MDGSGAAELPLTATIPDILANLYKGRDVQLGGQVQRPIEKKSRYIPRFLFDMSMNPICH